MRGSQPSGRTGATSTERLFSINADGPYEIKLKGADRLTRLDPEKLEAGLTELFVSAPVGLLFREDIGSNELEIALELQPPRFSADVQLQALIQPNELQDLADSLSDILALQAKHGIKIQFLLTVQAEADGELKPEAEAELRKALTEISESFH